MSTAKKTFPVVGMHCASCASLIKKRLEKLDGVESCVVNFGTEKAQVSFDSEKVNVMDMNKEINKLGYSLQENLKEEKLTELSKLKHHVQIIIPMMAVSI